MTDQPGAVDPDDNAHRPNQQSAVAAEISLAHLHPGIRHIALADDAVRLQAMRAKRWAWGLPIPPPPREVRTCLP